MNYLIKYAVKSFIVFDDVSLGHNYFVVIDFYFLNFSNIYFPTD